ncbi:MAG: PASTA domain-containing protein, partial [Oscillospiraceae bacterium]
ANGTGHNAYTAGYRIGGKTGTSETLDKERNIVSFVGFAPANDPQVIVLLAYDGPKKSAPGSNYTKDQYYISGGNMAAPMAGKLIANILDYMGVEKQYTPDELSGADTMVPKVTGHYLDYAESVLKQAGLTYRTVGEGTVVNGQIPASGATIPGNSQVVLYLGDEEVPTDQVEVPNVEGMTPEETQNALNKVGLYLRATGAAEYYVSSNKAASQSIAAGTLVDRGTVIEVRFTDSSIKDYTGAVMDD